MKSFRKNSKKKKPKKKKTANPFWKLAEQDVVTTLTVGNYDTSGCMVRA